MTHERPIVQPFDPSVARQFTGTWAMLSALLVGAFATQTATGRLTSAWLRRVGFAPRDLWQLDIGRLFTSALVTHGHSVLMGALVMTAISVGLLECQTGAVRALAVFWGVHLATIVILTLVFTPLHATLQSRATLGLVAVRDVGPSAGYFGALGAALGLRGSRAAHGLTVAVGIWLLLNLFGWVRLGPELPQNLSANLTHVIAMPMGWIVGRRWIRPGEEPAGSE
ncbi:MAG: hypothetical protein R3E10_15090 [Gemmatimonadota bacterium]